ncbi:MULTISPECIES: prepilin peptidase [unclassified Curtobacterium]|uniref:prepilin peptidase n=1 Tax=unclassified Curtobacterium TaxID=257496 RepID=UPI0039B09CC2
MSGIVIALATLSGALGLAVGSFLNVVVHRVPAGLSVVSPASACPNCGHGIRRRDNVPVISWLVLRARCRDCGTGISARYPVVELITGVAFVLVLFRFAPGSTTGWRPLVAGVLILIAFGYLMAVSVALAAIDLDTARLPNAITYPTAVVIAVLLTAAAAIGGDLEACLRAALGAIVLGGAYLVLAVAVPGGMGLGDVKLAVVIGFALAYLGWGPLAVGAFAAFVLGGSFAIGVLIVRAGNRRTGIPFGPWMLAGAWIGVFFGAPLWNAYLSLLGLA